MAYNRLIEPGALEIFCGPMKSGKTLELIHRVEKLRYMEDSKYQFFKPSRDTRDQNIKTRFNGLKAECQSIENPEEILQLADTTKCDLVAIDEAQFLPKSLVSVVEVLTKKDINVIVAGLDLDFRGEPFGPMPYLLAIADHIEKLSAVCQYPRCRKKATRTQRLIRGEPAHYNSLTIAVEGAGEETYEARCLKHHIVPR